MENGMRILCYGDSNTFGHDPRSMIDSRYPREVRWPGRLAIMGCTVDNLGLNGREIPATEAEIEAAIAQLCAHLPQDRVLIMLGTNDILKGTALRAEDAAARMERFLRRLLPALEGTPLLLIAPPPMARGVWVRQPELITESARLGACYAPMAQALGVDFADAGKWDIPLIVDGVHFTAEGHARFAKGVAEALGLPMDDESAVTEL